MYKNSNSRILIVDDEPAVVESLAIVLGDRGFVIETALSGEAALAVFATKTVDVLVTDIQMGGISGFELMEKVAELDEFTNSIVITAHDGYSTVKQALQLGAYHYLSKPLVDRDSICNAVERAAGATALARENASLLQKLTASHAMLEDANRRLRELNTDLRELASTDGLTGLYNRRYLDISLDGEISRRNRYSGALSALMIDIDHFKQINDTHGHQAGDDVLKILAGILTSCVRGTDIPGRFGGEEFLVILPETPVENALILAERLRKRVEEAIVRSGSESIQITVSLGVAGVSDGVKNVNTERLLAAVDSALYTAKSEGRNRISHNEILHEEEQRKAG